MSVNRGGGDLLHEAGHTGAKGFPPWLAESKEQVLDVTTMEFTRSADVVSVSRNRVKLNRLPEEIVSVSARTMRTTVAPWVRL